MAIMEISVVPIGTGSTSLSRYVAGAVKVLKGEEGLKYELTAMGTIVEGDLDRLMGLARRMHQAVLDAGAMRVVTTIKIDDRHDKASSINSKVEAVRRKLAG
ncbi:MAG: MTH1187 family thiamine-binding protein [Chloroflexi bacterium]|nr:MTH1187 family thiamine-binding protein [Chloroflexota bacterium]